MKKNMPLLFTFLFYTLVLLLPVIAFAEGSAIKVNPEAETAYKGLMNALYKVVQAGGDVLMIVGLWKYGVGFTSDQPKAFSDGLSFLLAGAVLANIKTIMG